MSRIFHKRICDVASSFGDVADSWDVVNESSRDWSRYRKSRTGLAVWRSEYGLMPGDYPLHALLDAKKAFRSQVRLAINDYNVGPDFLAQVKDLEKEGAKIDIVGCQMHLFNTNDCMRLAMGETNIESWIGTPDAIFNHLDMMAQTRRRLHVSEVTITSPGTDDRSRMIQAVLAHNVYRAWFAHPKTMGITWWNTVDGGGVKGEPLVSGLFTRDMRKKPIYHALDQLINHDWKTHLLVRAKNGKVAFRGFRGRYRLTWRCGLCDERHSRMVTLTGDGVDESGEVELFQECSKVVRSFTVDGRPTAICSTEEMLDLAAIYPGETVRGKDGGRWAEIVFHLSAPADGMYVIRVHNDYFGEISVNGAPGFVFDGPWDDFRDLKIKLRKGENIINYRTRSGSGGQWKFGVKIPSETGVCVN